ncbi:hypothetical protein K6675_000467 [Vibrio parahaemolyticus]|nr:MULTISPECIES: DUF6527 family protein [Vibrio harveyi group]ANB98498.1 hypothetical protein FORC14_0143 [Vibrio parahaemolyticus]EHK2864331.1 hypothetical protein [Vibrio parahaemolyticus]EHK9099296.1 hypothetical protein [Vibrio parahaemolyticus]EIA1329927.1 hypothetical protein [Vibrio parahaemolyticus]EID0730146.1 hypothetical protein [Vibrio parahaemolyticus]
MRKPMWLLRLMEYILPARKVNVIESDTPPDKLPIRNIVLAKEDDEEWAVGFKCPCGCGRHLELLLIKEAKPNWKLTVDEKNRPTLYPSIWLKKGCRSHFWLRKGKVVWC